MSATAQGIWNVLPLTSVNSRPGGMATNSAGRGSADDTTPASIAANDFLTLLVTEMKNQDPTATTDPNEYVNQLVQVNSLQQLISINETLQKATASTPAESGDRTPGSEERRSSAAQAAQSHGLNTGAASIAELCGENQKVAANRVAVALNGR